MASALYVDDDEANLTVFEAAVGRDLPVLTARGGLEALALMRQKEVGVLLTDQRMPGMSGVDLADAVRLEFPDTIRLLVTAFSDLNAAIDAINRGQVRRYLRKPWGGGEMMATVREALDLYHLTMRLRESERRLVQTERVYALGVIAASLGHELRNPLGFVTGNLQALRAATRDLAAQIAAGRIDPEDLRAQLDEMDEQITDALVGAERIKGVAQSVEITVRQTEAPEAIDLGDALRMSLRSVQGDLRRRCDLVLDTRPVPPVFAPRHKIGQVVLNLLVNAIEALPERPRDQNLIRIRLDSDGETVRLEIEDNGPGIAPVVMDRLFDPFFTTKPSGGTGLGLAISKRIVEELGGRIVPLAVDGGGARFCVTLPALGKEPLVR